MTWVLPEVNGVVGQTISVSLYPGDLPRIGEWEAWDSEITSWTAAKVSGNADMLPVGRSVGRSVPQ